MRANGLTKVAVLLAAWVGAPAQPAMAQEAAATAQNLDADPHLIGWWKLDESAGPRAMDSSSQGHHGALEGGLSFVTPPVPGRHGGALRFDGTDDIIRIQGFKGITGTAQRTVSAWIKTAGTSGDLVRWGADEPGQLWVFGHIRGRVGLTPRGGYLYMKAGTDDDTWHHVAVVLKASTQPNLHDDVRLFKDGAVAEIDDIGLLDLWPIETGDVMDLTIGRRFKGLIDDVRLYDRALSDAEIQRLYQAENHRPQAGPSQKGTTP